MDKKLTGSPPIHMRSGISSGHHLHSRIESQRGSASCPRPNSRDPAYATNNSILLSALHHGTAVQHQHHLPQLTVPTAGHHRPPGSQHHILPMSVGYQHNPHVPILQGPGLVNILPSGQGVTSSLKPELSRVSPHSQNSIAPLSVLHPTLPEFNILNSLHLSSMADPASINLRFNREMSGIAKSDPVKHDTREGAPLRTKQQPDAAYEHMLKRDMAKEVGWSVDTGEIKSFERGLGSTGNQAKWVMVDQPTPYVENKHKDHILQDTLFTGRNEIVRNITEQAKDTNLLLHKPVGTMKNTTPSKLQPSSSGEDVHNQKITFEKLPCVVNDFNSKRKVAFIVDSLQNNGTGSNMTDFDDFSHVDFSSHSLSNKNIAVAVEESQKLPIHSRQLTVIHPAEKRKFEGHVAKVHNTTHSYGKSTINKEISFSNCGVPPHEHVHKSVSEKNNLLDKTGQQNAVWTQHSYNPDIYSMNVDGQKSTKVSVCKNSMVTATTSVHLRPIQSVSSVDSKTQQPLTMTFSQNLPKVQSKLGSNKTDEASKLINADKLFKEVPFQNCSFSTGSSQVKVEPTAHDLLDVARKARDSQKAHLDVIKKTLEQSDFGLMQPGEMIEKINKTENVKQESVQSSPKLSVTKVESQPEQSRCSGVIDDEVIGRGEELELKLLEQHQSSFNKRPCTLNNFPVSQTSFRANYRSQTMAVHRAKMGSISTPVKSLDLLRQNLQKFINSELDSVVQKYMNMFFKPAAENIRKNSGIDAVSDDTIIMLCAQILEEKLVILIGGDSKLLSSLESSVEAVMHHQPTTPRPRSHPNQSVRACLSLLTSGVEPGPEARAKKLYVVDQRSTTLEGTAFDPGSKTTLQENTEIRASKHSLFHIKRRGSCDSDLSVSRKRTKKTKTWAGTSGRSTPSKKSGLDPVKKEGPKWDPDRLTLETEFVMGARANKALGLGNMRGRLYVKHPDLFKYIGDQDDKQWLNENRHMPSTGGKAYLLVVRDIYDIADTDEYRNSNTLQMDEIVSFKVPEWMIDKMKLQMKSQATARGPKVKTKQVVDQDEDRLPFSSVYSSDGLLLDSKSDIQMSPATTDQMDLLSVDQEEVDTPSVSPFDMTGGFTESSPMTSHLTKIDDEESLIASFQFQ